MNPDSPQHLVSNCEKEPIHIPGSIQPFGVLLVLDGKSFQIKNVSRNVTRVFGRSPDSLLGQDFLSLLAPSEVQRFHERVSEKRLVNPDPIVFSAQKGTDASLWNMFFIWQDENLLVEMDPRPANIQASKALPALQQCMERIQGSRDLNDLCQILSEEIRFLTKHDRVMIYRFGDDWHGEVIAESRREDMHSYLGHHFPASDIPKQARDVFTKTWLRMIPDATYEPQPLVPTMDPESGEPIQLGLAMLRSVSPIHLQYLKNMGVGASLTITLKHNDRLWGLIACHHEGPLFVEYETRSSCEVIGRLASSMIATKLAISDFSLKQELRGVYEKLLSYMSREEDLIEGLVKHTPNLLNLTRSDGAAAAIYFEGKWTVIGKTPTLTQIDRLVEWLSATMNGNDIFSTDSLASLFPEANEYKDVASGILAISIPKSTKNYILWFRPEVSQMVTWAGDPKKQIEKLPDGSFKIEPRMSFESWKEAVSLRSRPWRNPEIEAALELRTAILGLDLQRQFRLEQKARHQAEESTRRLEESEARLRALVELAPQMLFIANAEGEVTFFNDRFYEYCGFQFSEVGGEGWKVGNIHHPDDLVRTIARWERSVQTGEPYQNEYRLRRHDGVYRWHLSRAVALRNSQGQIQQWFGTNTDIHDQRIMEEERRVQAERIADLMQRSKESAEAANEAKSAFLANMSHEIRTPLGAILGFMDLMKAPDATREEINQYISVIDRNSHQLLRLVDDILDVSKVEAGKLLIESIDFSLTELLMDFTIVMAFKAKEKGIDFQLSLDTAIPSLIQGDPTRLRQVLNNVVSNAIKFTDFGRVDMHVSYRDEVLRIAVLDTGRGISAEQVKNLFQSFSQADGSTTRQFGGTGLGLVLARRLSEAMGGGFWLERSALGQGSLFIAEIKAEQALQSQMVQQSELGLSPTFLKGPGSEESSLQGLRVLLVEDSPDNQALIKIFMKKWGVQLDVASNGKQAVAKAKDQDKYDVILMDIQMPEMDGHQATRLIRQLGFKKPIVALTAHALKEERIKCLESGFSEFLSKPIEREVLRDLLQSLKDHA